MEGFNFAPALIAVVCCGAAMSSLELALKGIRSYFWAEGSLEIMIIIVARELLGKDFVAYR